MRCPRLHDLPAPPEGMRGWPWTIESSRPPESMPNGMPWPRLSMVTPSYNQGLFLEETIRSVLLQGYPNLEYIVIDGKSTDDSVKIIRKYEDWLTYWVSEPDRNQSHAINKGFRLANGTIYGWLNSDDALKPNGVNMLMELWLRSPHCVAWSGAAEKIALNGMSLGVFKPRPGTKREFGNFGGGACVYQPSTFFSAALFKTIGGINESLDIGLDVDLWMRLAERGQFATTDQIVSTIRIYPEAKHLVDAAATFVELVAINHYHGFADIARDWLLRFAESHAKSAEK